MVRSGQKKIDKVDLNNKKVKKQGETEPHFLSADRPITTKDEDLLDRTNFAVSLAKAINGWNEDDSLVVALYGSWGSGKSSIKNMVLEALRSKHRSLSTIVEFNPWQWAGQDQLAEAFFSEVEIALGKADTSTQGRHRAAMWHLYAQHLKVGSIAVTGFRSIIIVLFTLLGIIGFSSLLRVGWVAAIVVIVASVALVMAAVLTKSAEFTEELASLFSKHDEAMARSLDEIKDSLASDLSTLDAPVVIVIDDLDRLAPDQIQLMFQLVKANADFPNVVYLVLFQRTVIEAALGERGREFLEKIVQVGFDVPSIQQSQIETVLTGKLDTILSDTFISQRFDGERWVNLYHRGLRPFFRTLRDVHRFGGVFAFEVGLFRGDTSFEVNPINLIGLEVLRVFEPDVYQAISTEKVALTNNILLGLDSSQRERATKQAVDGILAYASKDRDEAVREIIKQLFPLVEWMFGGNHYSGDFLDQWYRELRLCHPDVFDRYFFLTIPQGDISQTDLDRVLCSLGDAERATAEFIALKQRGLLEVALQRLEFYKQKIDIAYAVPFITALFTIGEELSPSSGGMWEIDSFTHVIRIIHWYLATEPDEQQRTHIISDAVQASLGFSVPIGFIDRESDDNKNALLDKSHIPMLKELCVEKIRVAAQDGRLSSSQEMEAVLYRWQQWSSVEEPKKWVASLIQTDEGLLAFLRAFVKPAPSFTIGSLFVHQNWQIRLSTIEIFVNADLVRTRVKEIDATSLSEKDQLSLQAVEHAFERRRRGISEDAITHEEQKWS